MILGTAGHIDHGKTSLIRALTGVDTDRLPEEQRRGMTIELGFAELVIGESHFGVVDVPGHERFVRTMVSGATAIDLALLVVAADDSVMPQTVEHADILHLLGVSRGVVAVTKIDMVDEEMVELVMDDVRGLLRDTPLADAPICPVSSTTGSGLDDLKKAILSESAKVSSQRDDFPFRMAMDRVFTIQGRGTVVTGSVLSGRVSEGDPLEIWPAGDTCKARGLQSHGVDAPSIGRSERAAINLSGIDREQVQRGAELATPAYLTPTRMIDAEIQCLPSTPRPLKSAGRVRLEIGSVELPARIVLLHGTTLNPGEQGFAQLRGGESFVATHGQRFILRDENASRTIGGGRVLRPLAGRMRRSQGDHDARLRILAGDDAADRVEEALRAARFEQPTDLKLCARTGVALGDLAAVLESLKQQGRWNVIPGTATRVVPAALDDLGRRCEAWMRRYHERNPELPGRSIDAALGYLERLAAKSLARPLYDMYMNQKLLKRLGRFVCLPEFAPSLSAGDEKLMSTMIDEIRTGRFQPPGLDGLSVPAKADRKRWVRLATLAVALGELVQVDASIYLHAETEAELRRIVGELIQKEGGASVADVREALNSSRKFVVPFLEYLDRIGFTKRTGDQRILVESTGD